MSHQQLLQGFQKGTIKINTRVSVLSHDGHTTYFVDEDSICSHPAGDKAGEAHALAALMAHGHVRPIEIERSEFGIPYRTLMNWQRKYEEQGCRAFFSVPARRGPVVVTPEVAARCAQLFAEGFSVAEVGGPTGGDRRVYATQSHP